MCSKRSISAGTAPLVTAIHPCASEPAAHRALRQHGAGSQLQCLPVWLGGGSWDEMLNRGRHTANKSWLLKDSSLTQSRAGFEQGKKGCSVYPNNLGCTCTGITANVFLDVQHGSWDTEMLQGELIKECQHGHRGG